MAKSSDLLYRNDKYGFTLRFPSWWRNYCVVSKKKLDPDSEYELHFRFKYKGNVYDDIFTILVFRMTQEDWLRLGYGDSPLSLIAARDGRVFAYLTPEELPHEFINRKTGDYDYRKYGTPIGLLKRMVNRDVPRIVQTLRFSSRAITMKSTPYRSSKVCSCRIPRRRRKPRR
ncbi:MULTISPECIES: hypothetical protein [Paenibacillus]|uniref:Uncharacterized protein n=1 Tax=Paenibacillus validus TaxID=44253 RepID=A0A7X2ZD76_9BACL|nr:MULTISPECIES: hypothetical protein [Paenibacillus]MUG72083.1 hypothetical protein [Paenibacillus validus]